jgi:hypothetical protein
MNQRQILYVQEVQAQIHAAAKINMKKEQQGYIAIITTLIIAGFVIALLTSFPLTATDSLRSYLSLKKGMDSRMIANSCAEIALLKLQRDLTYEGENLSLDEGSCIIDIEETGDSERTITVEANLDQYIYNLEIEVKLFGRSVGIISWEAI